MWSQDGKQVAFASKRHGNEDVFVVPVAGGAIRRLTYHSGPDIPTSFSPDGTEIFFTGVRLGDPKADAMDDPTGEGLQRTRLYTVPTTGGRTRRVFPTAALEGVPSADGKRMLYVDHPAPYENEWRKHQVSAAARDIWMYDAGSRKHTQLTTFRGEDRNPVWSGDGKSMYWLSEQAGSFNVWRKPLAGGKPKQITGHKMWPVRFLSIAKDGTLVYVWNGEIWRLKPGAAETKRVPIRIRQRAQVVGETILDVTSQVSDFVVSPDGTQIALVARGEVFVASTIGGGTRRITNTPAQEKYVTFAPDGRRLAYATERNGTWDIVEARLAKSDKSFTGAAPIKEVFLVKDAADTYQPVYSPKGDRIVYLHDRSALRVLDIASGKSIEVLPPNIAYSYNEGDLKYCWAPNGRWLLTQTGFFAEIEMIDAAGREKRRNVSLSGFHDLHPQVSADGQIALWLNDRKGLKSTTGSPDEMDVYAAFLTREAFANFRAGKSTKPEAEAKTLPNIKGLERRKIRLTPFSGDVTFFRLSPDNKRLVCVLGLPNGTTACYAIDTRTHAVRTVFTRPGRPTGYDADKKVTAVYELGAGAINRYDVATGKRSAIRFKAEMKRNAPAEIAAIFQSNWRITAKTFYDPKMHGVDWKAVGDHYRRFLPHITQWEDFAELLNEMVGELNASHQASHYIRRPPSADDTGSLGLYYDDQHRAARIRTSAVLPDGPADRPGSALKPGAIITAVDGRAITAKTGIHQLLNRKSGKEVLLTIQPAGGGKSVSQRVKPVSLKVETSLVYERWVAKRRALVTKLSNGRIGYVHLLSMAVGPYQRAYAEAFGRHKNAEAIIVDIRSNGGGNIHDQLIAMLTGRHDSSKVNRNGVVVADNPIGRWTRPSVVVANANSYSDGSVFPTLYQHKKVGPIIGTNVPGTGTAVVRPPLIERYLTYGIPEMGFRLTDGRYFENMEVKADVLIHNTPASIAAGKDLQIEAAVKHLLMKLKAK